MKHEVSNLVLNPRLVSNLSAWYVFPVVLLVSLLFPEYDPAVQEGAKRDGAFVFWVSPLYLLLCRRMELLCLFYYFSIRPSFLLLVFGGVLL